MNNNLPWSEVEKKLKNLHPVEGGNSNARRGLITFDDGKNVFVKIGIDDPTKAWAKKEIHSYIFLANHSFPFIPQLLSVNEDETGFAIEALLPQDGWSWVDTWDLARLNATFDAMDRLAKIQPENTYLELLSPIMDDKDNGWLKLAASEEQQNSLTDKLKITSAPAVIESLAAHVEQSSSFHMRHDTLVHFDIRADNCAWNASRPEVSLVDWNWLQLGDRRIDLAATLAHVHKSGFNVLEKYRNRLDLEALHWMAGFWLEAASRPIWSNGPQKLREAQLQSGIAALQLTQELG